jgi:hypothetical protein
MWSAPGELGALAANMPAETFQDTINPSTSFAKDLRSPPCPIGPRALTQWAMRRIPWFTSAKAGQAIEDGFTLPFLWRNVPPNVADRLKSETRLERRS